MIRAFLVSRVRAYVRLSLIAVGLCGVTWAFMNWFQSTDEGSVPAGFERTCIPGIFVDRRLIDMGTITADNAVEATFRLFNASKRTYSVRDISTDCTCATVTLRNPTLPRKAILAIPVRMTAQTLT